MTRFRRATLTAAVIALTVALGACAPLVSPRQTVLPSAPAVTSAPPTATPAPVPSPSTSRLPSALEGSVDCGSRPVVVTAGAPHILSGDCPEVQVQGSDLVLDTTAASVALLDISGDRVRASLGEVGQLTLAGNDGDIGATRMRGITVRGDRNTVTATDGIEGVLVQGNDNTVRGAGELVADEGARNTIE